MKVPALPFVVRLWVARALAAVGVAATLAAGDSPVRLAIDVAALVLCAKRRFRYACALWFGCSAFVQMIVSADHGQGNLARALAAVALALATAILVTPLLRAPNQNARLAPLSGSWALVAALVATAVDVVVVAITQTGRSDEMIFSAFTSFGLLFGCVIASQLGWLRWPLQLIIAATIAGAHATASTRPLVRPSHGWDPSRSRSAWIGFAPGPILGLGLPAPSRSRCQRRSSPWASLRSSLRSQSRHGCSAERAHWPSVSPRRSCRESLGAVPA
jgi:hypothetical protein